MLKSLLSYAIAIAAAIYLPMAANPNLGPPASILCCLLVVLYIHQNEAKRVRAKRGDRRQSED